MVATAVVLDPFAGSNVTREVCERLNRKWIAIEIVDDYLKGSNFRFVGGPESNGKGRRKRRDKKKVGCTAMLFD